MKKCSFFILLMMFSTILLSADLIDVYKKGPIKLVPDPEFGKNTDWEKLFFDYNKVTSMGKPIGTFKDMAIASDGSIYISNYSQYNVYKFDKNGNFIKKFGQKGKKPGEFFRRPGSLSILDNKYLMVPIYHGRIHLFDLDGNFIKRIQMDYPIPGCVALKNNKIAVAGFVPYKGKKSKNLIAIKDIDTEKENILTYYFKPYFKDAEISEIKVGDESYKFYLAPAFSRESVFIRRSLDGNLIVGYSNKKYINVYSPEGENLNDFTLNIEPLKITEKIKEEYYESSKKNWQRVKENIQKIIEKKQKGDMPEVDLKEIIEKPIDFPKHMPYYYYLTVDSDGNILVFLYTEENEKHRFQVYSPEGTFICESVIDPGEYKIKLNSKINSLLFSEGDLFALVALKDNTSIPLRLIKVNLSDS